VRGVRVTAIVLLYRFWPGVTATIESLLAGETKPDRLIVIDNDPDGNESDHVRAAYPAVEVIDSEHNGGYAGGMNIGLAAAGDEGAVLLLTHECLLARDALTLMLAELDDPGVGAVGPLLCITGSDNMWGVGGWVNRGEEGKHVGPIDDWLGRPSFDTDYTDGACILLRSAAVRGLLFDTRYFMYWEEVDFLARLRRSGWKVRAVPRARAWHSPGGCPISLYTRNQLLFTERCCGYGDAARMFLLLVRSALGAARRRKYGDGLQRLRGLWSYSLRRWGPMR
jgi:GT2 family glycosyltransferase